MHIFFHQAKKNNREKLIKTFFGHVLSRDVYKAEYLPLSLFVN